MKLPERLLFVGAHCDDIELFAGGLLTRACSEGKRVGVLVCSDHRGVLSEAEALRARGEFHENLAMLRGLGPCQLQDHSRLWWTACQGQFQRERAALYAALEAIRVDYDWVISHAPSDTNQDHQQVAQEVIRCCKATCSVLAGEFPYDDVGGFTPQVFVRLTAEQLSRKVTLIQRYESQRINGRPYLAETAIRGLAQSRGAQVSSDAAEAFQIAARVIV
ncbi:MAG: PIG-L deacetylase family protein [Polyangiaceae bacterium]